MQYIRKPIERERFAGSIIFICLLVILLTMVGIRLLDVKVLNIKHINDGMYTILTDYGSINTDKNDILRIERTYTKVAITGMPVELDKIYTTKGFIYFSSLDSFYPIGHQLINSVDFIGNPVWIRPIQTAAVEISQIQLQNENLKIVQQYSYAIGTPEKYQSIVFLVLFIQYLALAVGAAALLVLIFPLRFGSPAPVCPFSQHDPDFRPAEEQLGAVAK